MLLVCVIIKKQKNEQNSKLKNKTCNDDIKSSTARLLQKRVGYGSRWASAFPEKKCSFLTVIFWPFTSSVHENRQ